MLDQLEEAELDIDLLAGKLNLSRITFYRKIKVMTDMPPHDYINLIRLKKAAELISEGNHKIYEVASMTGYKSATHFSKLFYKQFGLKPMQFMRTQATEPAERQ